MLRYQKSAKYKQAIFINDQIQWILINYNVIKLNNNVIEINNYVTLGKYTHVTIISRRWRHLAFDMTMT